MITLPKTMWTDAEIMDVLKFKYGSLQSFFRFDVLRGGARRKSIPAKCTVSMNRFAVINRTATWEIYEEIDFLNEELRPVMLLRMPDEVTEGGLAARTWNERDALGYNWNTWDAMMLDWNTMDAGLTGGGEQRTAVFCEFPLGVFVPATPMRTRSDGRNVWQIESYDHTVFLSEDSFAEPYTIAQGTGYIEAIQAIMAEAGIENFSVLNFNTDTLRTDRVFEVGEKKLTCINSMLAEIGFSPLHCDELGRFVLRVDPIETDVADIAYYADELSVISLDNSSETDYYNIPNVFIATCSNADIDPPLFSVFTNDDPGNPLSTVRRGRNIVSEIYSVDDIASQEALDAYIERIAMLYNMVLEHIEFSTALMPIHGRGNVLNLRHPDLNGIFSESSWEFPCEAGAQMLHTARRYLPVRQ